MLSMGDASTTGCVDDGRRAASVRPVRADASVHPYRSRDREENLCNGRIEMKSLAVAELAFLTAVSCAAHSRAGGAAPGSQ
jgi:hypothetical protein